METLNIPAGYTHRSELIERGWTARQITEHLPVFIKIDAPEGTSNKAYADAEITRIEQENGEIRKAVAAKADRVPTAGPYTEENTISRAALLGRGWTAAHINRLLGDPDSYGFGIRTESHRYGSDRVEWAEHNDVKLIKRLAAVAKKKAETLAAKVEDDGEIIFRHVNGEWMLEGMDLTEGEEVTVSKKDGSTTQAWVGKIVSDVEGRRLAKVGKRPPTIIQTADQARKAWGPQEPISESPVYLSRPATVLASHPGVGSTIEVNGKRARVLTVMPFYIDSDGPSVYGAHLLGHEDEWGSYVEYEMEHPSPEEVEREAAERNALIAKRSRAQVQRQVERIICKPENFLSREDAAQVLSEGLAMEWDGRMGGVGAAVAIDGDQAILVSAHGMDGDDWSMNNAAGHRIWRTSLTEVLAALIAAGMEQS